MAEKGQDYTVLVADDEPEIVNLVRTMLEWEGYTVLDAADGEEAVACAHDRLPDLILMDVRMPKMNGLAVLESLRADPDTVAIPVIMLSVVTTYPEVRKALQKGAIAYLPKPFELKEMVRSCSGHRRGWSRGHTAAGAEEHRDSLVNRPNSAQPCVLIVEDEEGLLEILEINFRSAGYQVFTAADGIAGWQRFDQNQPDLLVLDLNLPQMSGFRLLELVRSESDLPILILTAYDFAEAEEVARYRPDAFVKKPFHAKELIALANRLVGQRSNG
jgi:DNA-binding response OmpR family regulator